jgi:hypothetical protein
VKDSLRGYENSLPSIKKFRAGLPQIPARAAQGIWLKPPQQLHKTVFESSDRVAIRKNSLQDSLRAGKVPACAA